MIQLESVSLSRPHLIRGEQTLCRSLKKLWERALQPNYTSDPHQTHSETLKDINLTIAPSERVGLIGKNGAGKTSLLRVLAKVFAPTSGSVKIDGNINALLSLNSGFNHELTGIDNAKLWGALQGFSQEQLESLLPEIIRFSELGEKIYAPVRTYSSGMIARLGFAISTSFRPDILLIDEVLGVGDGAFRAKCTVRMEQLFEQSSILVLCSHNLNTIKQNCERVVWMHDGTLFREGATEEILPQYQDFLDSGVLPTPDIPYKFSSLAA